MKNQYQDIPQNTNSGDQIPITTPSMIRSHSASGDLHGVQPDPIAADILRKEPEHETFVRLKISPRGTFFLFIRFLTKLVYPCLELFLLSLSLF